MNDLVAQNTDLTADIGQTDEISWTGSENMTFDQYQAIGKTFQQIQRSLCWWTGDWLNYGEQKFGDVAAQAVDDTGKTVETLLKWKAVAFRVPRNIRVKELGWTFHFYIAYVPEEERGVLLQMALNVGISSRELKDVVKLDDDVRHEFILAYDNYMNEYGPMDRDTFLSLLNRFKLNRLSDNGTPDEDDEDDAQDEDDVNDPGSGESAEEVIKEDVSDFWENQGAPVTFINGYSTFWEGISVRAALDKQGKARLVWEKLDNGEE